MVGSRSRPAPGSSSGGVVVFLCLAEVSSATIRAARRPVHQHSSGERGEERKAEQKSGADAILAAIENSNKEANAVQEKMLNELKATSVQVVAAQNAAGNSALPIATSQKKLAKNEPKRADGPPAKVGQKAGGLKYELGRAKKRSKCG